MKIKLTSFRQQVILETNPKEIFDQLMNSKKHSLFSGGKAVIGKKEGDSFSVYDGYAYGKNVELVKNQKIVQTWRAEEEGWPADCMSLITFELKPIGENKTKILFKHENLPSALSDNFKKGWKDYYWEPLKAKYNLKK